MPRQRESANWLGYLFDEDDVTLGDLSEGSAAVSTKARLDGLVTIQDEGKKRLREDGCIFYEATIDAENAGPSKAAFGPDTFVVVEKRSSMDAR